LIAVPEISPVKGGVLPEEGRGKKGVEEG